VLRSIGGAQHRDPPQRSHVGKCLVCRDSLVGANTARAVRWRMEIVHDMGKDTIQIAYANDFMNE